MIDFKRMSRFLFIVFLCAAFTSCNKTTSKSSPQVTDPHPKLTLENVDSFCAKPAELYPIPVMTVYSIVE